LINSSIHLYEIYPCFELYFVLVWAEQGDEISLEYAGTHALKGDLVRYEIIGTEILSYVPFLVNVGFTVQIWKTNNNWNNQRWDECSFTLLLE
jgi:hypothetical protein